jgi:uncharacterized protein
VGPGGYSVLKLGRDEIFFELLDKQAKVAQDAADAFLVMVRDLGHSDLHTKTLKDIEHLGDDYTHQLQNRVAATFIPPIDQEDLSELSNVLDDITDYIEATGARIEMYRLTEAREYLIPLAEQLVQITRLVVSAVAELHFKFSYSSTLKETLKQIHTIENESDLLFRSALSNLFHEPGVDPITVMKWKEVYDRVETAVDRCEDVAKVLDNMIVKYA